jgi:hypothetical protein
VSVHHLTLSPRASPVQASVSLPFASAESHARFSFGVKLNLTIFLLELEIQSHLHFCDECFGCSTYSKNVPAQFLNLLSLNLTKE